MHTKSNKTSTHLVKGINESIFTWLKSLCAGGRKREAQKAVEQQPNEHRAEPEKHSPPPAAPRASAAARPPREQRGQQQQQGRPATKSAETSEKRAAQKGVDETLARMESSEGDG